MSDQVRFIRVNGRVVPIRGKGKNSSKDGSKKLAGAAGVVGGSIAVKKAAPRVTGRTTLYHGTTKTNAEKIMAKGLQRNASHGIGDMLEPSVKARNYTYMTRSKAQAKSYAAQAEGLDRYVSNRSLYEKNIAKSSMVKDYARSADRVLDTQKARLGLGGGKVTKASVPLWKKEFRDMAVKNPELGGATNGRQFTEVLAARTGKAKMSTQQGKLYYKALDTPTFDGDIASKYFKGSKNYQRLSFGEVAQYAASNRGRFASGLALGAAGVAGIGLGAYALLSRSKKEK